MSNENSHLPIFPTTMQTENGTRNCFGLSKREYFAAMAMQGWLASYPAATSANPQAVATQAVKFADALIEQLNK